MKANNNGSRPRSNKRVLLVMYVFSQECGIPIAEPPRQKPIMSLCCLYLKSLECGFPVVAVHNMDLRADRASGFTVSHILGFR